MIPLNQTLSVLLVEDDQQVCEQIVDYSKNFLDIKIIEVTNNSDSAYKYVVEHSPDAVILDLELQQGSGNGLSFLNNLHNFPNIKKPYILITTNNPSNVTQNYARKKGADFVLYKQSEDYTNHTPIDFLRMTMEVILASKNQQNKQILCSPTNESTIDTEQIIIRQLETLGFQHNILGFNYLKDAILLVINDPSCQFIQIISTKSKKSFSSVERAMHNAIDRVWKYGNLQTLQKEYTSYINPIKGMPTITEFVFFFADKIKKLKAQQ